MSPLPGPRMARHDSRKVRNPMRAGGPETGKADPSTPRDLEVQAGRDVTPPKGEKVGLATTSESPDGWSESSEGENPRKASTVRRLRPPGGSTDSPREGSPGGHRDARIPPGRFGRPARSGGQGLREEYPSRARGTPWRGKPMDAPALRRREDAPGMAVKGVAKPRTRSRTAGGPAVNITGACAPGMCRRAGKPRRGSTRDEIRVGTPDCRDGACGALTIRL
jgi:hypothetical protein